jgi:hypothetical protein
VAGGESDEEAGVGVEEGGWPGCAEEAGVEDEDETGF